MSGPASTNGGALAAVSALRSRVRRALVVERCAQAVAFGVAAIACAALVDRVLRLPPPARAAELAALLAGGAAWAWLRVIPALRFRPPLVEVALRLERGSPEAAGKLATGTEIELSATPDGARRGEGVSAAFAALAVERAGEVATVAAPHRVDVRPARRALGLAAIALVAATALALLSPATARIALLRLVTPFSDVQWPARTMVEPAMAGTVHPRGAALALRARAVRGDPVRMRVEAEYRLLRDGSGEWRTVTLTAQPDGTFERLVDSDADAAEVVFRTEDMETLPVTVRLLPPPSVVSATVRAEPPAYLRGVVEPREAELGDGTDRRATLSPPVLAGSRITLVARMEGTAPPPEEPEARAAWLARAVSLGDGDGTAGSVEFTAIPGDDGGATWTIGWEAFGRGVLELRPEGAEGIAATQRIAFEVPTVEDAPPAVAIVRPESDESVTAAAVPELVAEARDDLGVTRMWMEIAVVRDGKERRAGEDVQGPAGTASRLEHRLSIAATGAQPGDSVVCTARALDAFERAGVPRAPVSGTPRVFRVISATELADQVRSRLGQMREAADRLRDEQRATAQSMESLAEAATDQDRAQAAGRQARMADRIGSFERSLGDLSARLERNGAGEDGLQEALEEAARLARSAGTEAQRATESAKERERASEAASAARSAEASLSDLAASLARDRETAELSRRIDRLAERIDAARKDTQQAASRSVGKQRSQLPEEVRAQLDRAAQDQREAAAEARELSEDLSRRADEAEREGTREPGTAEALRAAQEEADKGGLARQLEQAAQQTAENQMQSAQRSQAQARQAVERMQEAMRSQRRRRAAELERRITESIEAIRALLAGTERRSLPLQRLEPADADGASREAAEVLGLSRNAGGVAETVAASGGEMSRTASLVARGAERLDGCAVSLRALPADLPAARGALEDARTSFQEALAAAEKAKSDAERAAEDRRREELRDAYSKVLDRQRGARAGTEGILPAPGAPLERRAFVESKRLAADQQQVGAMLRELGARADIAGSELYAASNDELLAASASAERELGEPAPSARTVLSQREVESGIAAVMEALADPPEPEDPFAEAPRKEGGQGGGGQQQQQKGEARVPPIAELRLLRTMAQRVLDDTAAAAALPDPDRPAYLERVAQRQARILDLGERWSKAMKEERERSGQSAPPQRREGAP